MPTTNGHYLWLYCSPHLLALIITNGIWTMRIALICTTRSYNPSSMSVVYCPNDLLVTLDADHKWTLQLAILFITATDKGHYKWYLTHWDCLGLSDLFLHPSTMYCDNDPRRCLCDCCIQRMNLRIDFVFYFADMKWVQSCYMWDDNNEPLLPYPQQRWCRGCRTRWDN